MIDVDMLLNVGSIKKQHIRQLGMEKKYICSVCALSCIWISPITGYSYQHVKRKSVFFSWWAQKECKKGRTTLL